ncbi:NADH-quinone oxidoreductase chain 2 [Jannaschia aquimarina]|uniref:Nqo2 protein n=1 Tax=Jannaschia aquimarina TaxID=935700 RepID=A0A0D1EG28_9RHOB|nr:NADH-quinone oxidoreductase subunit NuoE [Jannaschia aquimarina]KIT15816.1 NADH-quinone oxidoreductase chain 2 [Jannaschia aquimarina]SNT09276.1 NADH-quinone oxidoreductase, E subunit [Jannaschia aquimarina]
MLRRLHPDQPDTFAFTPANQEWAEAQITKYPEGRQASAVIPLLWRAQEQEGWLTRPAMEHVAEMLGMAYIRVLEVATFYFMFQLRPVGSVAHIQICGTTSCMICGAEDLVEVCRKEIAPKPHQISEDGKLSWEEVECLGACANAPMAQIGKDYYEDLTTERFEEMLREFRAGEVPTPGPQAGRWASEPAGGVTSLTDHAEAPDEKANASVALATSIGDTIKRIDGTEVPLVAPWGKASQADEDPQAASRDPLLGPSGPDGKQGGRVADEAEAPRSRGDASDGRANVRGSEATARAKPEPGSVAPDPEGKPGDGLGADATAAEKGVDPGPQVTGTTDDDGEPKGTKTAAESTSTPDGSTGSGSPEGASGDISAPRADAQQAPVGPGGLSEQRGSAPAAGSTHGHDAQTESGGVAGGPEIGAEGPGTRPDALKAPRDGQADDLKRIRGIGPKLETLCNDLGFYHFDQIAGWSDDEVAWVDSNLEGFKGRVTRDEWVKQAKLLASGGETEFSSRVDKGDVY